MHQKYYITTAIPYVNGRPHIGHALEYFQADTVRRYQQLLGKETLLLSGADENALKNVQAAEKEGTPINEFLERNSLIFKQSYQNLGVHLDVFQRGSDKEKHWPGVEKLWKLCVASGDIYKRSYRGWYCVGCESFKTEKDLVDGLCPEHQKKPDLVNEENYFFRLSRYQKNLLELIKSNKLMIRPENKRTEILAFVESGLEDFSVSRSKERARGVGVLVPGDPNQVIYVWFDALDIYMTGVGFGWDSAKWKKWWPADLHVIGKDINRFHTVYWPAMLLSAKIPLPREVLVHSFVNAGGLKMSKSIGNVISPEDLVGEFGLEPLRYYLLSQVAIDSDGDFTHDRFKEVYNAYLANGLGNLVARVAALAQKAEVVVKERSAEKISDDVAGELEQYRFDRGLALIWERIRQADQLINERRVWEQGVADRKKSIVELVGMLRQIAIDLQPFLPETSAKILNQFGMGRVLRQENLFNRL